MMSRANAMVHYYVLWRGGVPMAQQLKIYRNGFQLAEWFRGRF